MAVNNIEYPVTWTDKDGDTTEVNEYRVHKCRKDSCDNFELPTDPAERRRLAEAILGERILTDPYGTDFTLRPDVEVAPVIVQDLVEAIRLTVEYVGNETLPAKRGWSWFDALVKHAPDVAQAFVDMPVLPVSHQVADVIYVDELPEVEAFDVTYPLEAHAAEAPTRRAVYLRALAAQRAEEQASKVDDEQVAKLAEVLAAADLDDAMHGHVGMARAAIEFLRGES